MVQSEKIQLKLKSVKCKLTLSASVSIACVLVALLMVQHVELAETWGSNRSGSFSSISTGIRSRIDSFNVGQIIEPLRPLIGILASKTFEIYTKIYNKTYTPEEIGDRLNMFVEHFNTVKQWNKDFKSGKVSYSMKLNHLADRSPAELNQMNGLKTPRDFDRHEESSKSIIMRSGQSSLLSAGRNLAAVPDTKDWRQSACLPAIRDQGNCGCCYAFATVDLVGTNYCLESGTASSRLLRSPQQIIDCGSRDYQYGVHMNGCNGGWPEYMIKYLQKKQYLASEASYPYKARKETCKLASGLQVSNERSRGPKYVELYTEQDFKNHIGQHGPVVAAMHATDGFTMYNSGLFDDSRCLGRQWNHAVLVVGYGKAQGKDYWLIKNSYGTDWGERGYMRMVRGKSLCKIGKMGWGLIPSTSSSSSDYSNTDSYSNFFPWSSYFSN